jgi:type I restriction enzyme S subunit
MRQLQFTDCVEIVGEACQPFSGYKQYVSTGAVAINHISNDDIELVDYDGKPSRANLIAKSGDILFAKMMGTKKTLHLDEDTAQNIYSTGFCAVRARPTVLTDRCLYHLLTSKAFLDQKDKNCSGATQKAITNAGLSKITIKVPSIGQQASIAQQLDRIASIIALRQSELQKLDELIKARFVEMFGDPVYNSKRLPIQRLCKLGSLDRGRSQHRPRNDPKLLNGPYPLIQTGEVASAGLYITKYKNTYSELGLRQSKMWSAGTLCITIAANIAQTAILTFDACFPDSVVGFLPNDSINAIYMHYWFGFFQKILEKQAPQVAQKNINLKILSELNVIVPTQEKQEQFAAFVEQVDKSKVAVQKALDEAQLLFDSLMQKYFG